MNQNESGQIRGYTPRHAAQPQQHQPPQYQAPQYQQPQYQQPQYQQPQYQQPQYQQPQYQQPQHQQPQYQPPQYQAQQYQQPQYQEPQQRQTGGLAAFVKRRNTVLLISAIVSLVWLIVSYSMVQGALNAAPTGDSAEELAQALGTAIGAAMLIPFFVITFIGTVFNWVAWFTSRKGFALTAGILFSVSLLFGFSYALGIIPCVVLAFVGYAKLKKQQAGQQ